MNLLNSFFGLLATNSWDSMFTEAGTAVTSLGTSAATLIGIVFAAIILLLVGFGVAKRVANKAGS